MPPVEHFEQIFKKYFQRQITIRIGDYEVKTGRLLLIRNNIIQNNFYFELIIENTKKVIVFKLPYPFALDEYPDEGLLYLDYRFKTLINDPALVYRLQQIEQNIGSKKPSKFIDTIIEIQFT